MEDLIQACTEVLSSVSPDVRSISRRQIFQDIAFMESDAGWRIDLEKLRDGHRIYYRYRDTGFSISNMPLNNLEIDQLRSALSILSQFQGMPQFEWVHELIPKLQQGVEVQSHDIVIDFDHNRYLKGIEYLGLLYQAIRFHKVLKIHYRPFESEVALEYNIHPYYLKQYNNRWFLFGLNQDLDRSDWNLALDRIERIEESKLKYIKNLTIAWSDYFDDIVGVTKPENAKVEEVILHFFGKTANYMASKPLHGSQKIKWLPEKVLEVRLQLILNYEFERLILSYADQVKIVSPGTLRERIIARLRAGLKNY